MLEDFLLLDSKRGPLSPLLLLPSALFGLVVTVGLAWFMSSLITGEDMSLIDDRRSLVLDFIRINRTEAVERRERKVQRPQSVAAPNLPMAPAVVTQASRGPALSIDLPSIVTGSLLPEQTLLATGATEGDYLPIVKVAPLYPMRAVTLGIFGECMVRYDVTTTGATRNVGVVPGKCADPVFERPSIDAAKRFKYKPRVIGGVPVEVLGVHNVFHFTKDRP